MSKVFYRSRVWLLIMGICFFSQGCLWFGGPVDGPVITGDVEVLWLFDQQEICPNDVLTVEVQIDGVDNVETRCENGRVRVSNLAPGTYTIAVVGRDETGLVTWTSVAADVDILAERVAESTFNLLP